MVRSAPHNANSPIQVLLARVLTAGYMTRLDHLQLASALLSDRRIDQAEHHQISLLFDQVQLGRIKIQG